MIPVRVFPCACLQETVWLFPYTAAHTAAARLNGYIGGYGTAETLQDGLSELGLSEAGNKKLLEIADRGLKPGCALP